MKPSTLTLFVLVLFLSLGRSPLVGAYQSSGKRERREVEAAGK